MVGAAGMNTQSCSWEPLCVVDSSPCGIGGGVLVLTHMLASKVITINVRGCMKISTMKIVCSLLTIRLIIVPL